MVEPNHENIGCKNVAVMIILVCCSAGIFKEVLVPLWSYLMSGLHGYEKRGKIIYLSPLLFSDIYAYSNCFDITLSLRGELKRQSCLFQDLKYTRFHWLNTFQIACCTYVLQLCFFSSCNHSVVMIFSYCFIFKPQSLTATVLFLEFTAFWYFSGATFKWKFPKLIVTEVIRRSCCWSEEILSFIF